jgi:hypothetical protein
MKALRTFRSLRLSRNPLVTFVWFVVVIFAAYKTAEAILSDDFTIPLYAFILFLSGAVVMAILNDWRRGLYLLVAWILLEDLARKYLAVPGQA